MQWLAVVLGTVIFILYATKTRKTLIIAIAVSILVLPSITDFNEIFATRFFTIFDVLQPSNEMKIRQLEPLLGKYADHIIIGNGFGMYIPHFIRSVERPFSYELNMVALLAKLGTIGYLLLCGIFAWVLWTYHKLILLFQVKRMLFYSMLSIWGGVSIIILLMADFTNPYFISPLGMFYFMFFVVLLDYLQKMEKDAS
jgi:hypothetical protein